MNDNAMVISTTIPRSFTAVPDAFAALRPLCEKAEMDAGAQALMELGLAEILNNIVEHGYGSADGSTIRVRGRQSDRGVVVVIDVAGEPVELPSAKAHAPHLPITEQAERGRGLWLIEQCFSAVAYYRRGDSNRVFAYRAAA